MEDGGRPGYVKPKEEELSWEYPYEADLQNIQPENDHRILVCMARTAQIPGEKEEWKEKARAVAPRIRADPRVGDAGQIHCVQYRSR